MGGRGGGGGQGDAKAKIKFQTTKIKIFVVSIEYNLFKGEMICYMNNCYLSTNVIALGVPVSCS